MKLSEKGRFEPPPTLPKLAQKVLDAVSSWPDVHARAHWFLGDEEQIDGADFYVGEDEVGHIHLDGEAHVMFSRSVADAIVDAKAAKRLPWAAIGTVVAIKSTKDVGRALWLFRLSYDRRKGVAPSKLLERVAELGRVEEQSSDISEA